MFIELVELLRCTRPHEESWLVASIDELRERSIVRGELGCPVCSAHYPITDGVARFTESPPPEARDPNSVIDANDAAVKAGAFLGLAESSGVVLLGGSWSRAGASLAQSLDIRVIAVNGGLSASDAPGVGRIIAADVIPLGAASCAGAALDESFSPAAVSSALRTVRPGGRMVGPRSVQPPSELVVLAQDDDWWVAERPPAVTTLRRGNR